MELGPGWGNRGLAQRLAGTKLRGRTLKTSVTHSAPAKSSARVLEKMFPYKATLVFPSRVLFRPAPVIAICSASMEHVETDPVVPA